MSAKASNINVEGRRYERHVIPEAVVLTPMGVCQANDISYGGLSFRCLQTQAIPDEWYLDILDSGGVYLQKICVEKVWENRSDSSVDELNDFRYAVGVKFKGLKSEQKKTLNQILSGDQPDTASPSPFYVM